MKNAQRSSTNYWSIIMETEVNSKPSVPMRAEEGQDTEKSCPERQIKVHKTQDIYLAGYCGLLGCEVDVERPLSSANKRSRFVIKAFTDELDILLVVQAYFKGKASCDPKALKYKITDLKNLLYGENTG